MSNVISPPSTIFECGNDPALLAQVLRPYKPHCRYLKSASLTWETDFTGDQRASCRCVFEIVDSCYIDSTGHFNSVEFNICFNQMLYYVLAKLVENGATPAFHGWTMADYWSRQLPSVLIVDFHSTFRRAIRGPSFAGELEIVGIREHEGGHGAQPLIFVDTVCRYWDDDGGYCHGEVKLAVTDLPGQAGSNAIPR